MNLPDGSFSFQKCTSDWDLSEQHLQEGTLDSYSLETAWIWASKAGDGPLHGIQNMEQINLWNLQCLCPERSVSLLQGADCIKGCKSTLSSSKKVWKSIHAHCLSWFPVSELFMIHDDVVSVDSISSKWLMEWEPNSRHNFFSTTVYQEVNNLV